MQNMSIALGRMLVDRAELESLRRRLPEVAVLENAGLPATVTLRAGDDTAKDLPAIGASPAEPLRVGGMLGKYLLTDWAGEGAAGVAYRAFHPTWHIPGAVTVVHPVQRD